MGQLSNRREITGLETGNLLSLYGSTQYLYTLSTGIVSRYSYNTQTRTLSSRTTVGPTNLLRIGFSYRAIGNPQIYIMYRQSSNSYNSVISTNTINNARRRLDVVVSGIYANRNDVIIGGGNTIYHYTRDGIELITKRTMGTVSGLDIIRSLTVFGDKLLVAGHKNNLAILFEMDYDLTTKTISNIEQVTGTFLYNSPNAMTVYNNKLIVFGRAIQGGSSKLYEFDYTQVDLRTKTISDSITSSDSVGITVQHIPPKLFTDFLPYSDIISIDQNQKFVNLIDGEPVSFVDDFNTIRNGGNFGTTGWTLDRHTSTLDREIILRNNWSNEGRLLYKTYQSINPTGIKINFTYRRTRSQQNIWVRITADGVQYNSSMIPINTSNNFRSYTIIPTGLPDNITNVMIEWYCIGRTTLYLKSWKITGPSNISDDITTDVTTPARSEMTDTISSDDMIELTKFSQREISDDIPYKDNIKLTKFTKRNLSSDIIPIDSVDTTGTIIKSLFDALYDNPKKIIDNFDDGTTSTHGWDFGTSGVAARTATITPTTHKIFDDFNPNGAIFSINQIIDSSPNDYRVKITAGDISKIYGPYRSNQPNQDIILQDFPSIRTSVRVEFVGDRGSFAFFVRNLQFKETPTMSDNVELESLIVLSDGMNLQDSLLHTIHPFVNLSSIQEITDKIIASTAKEIIDSIIDMDKIELTKFTDRKITSQITPQDNIIHHRTEITNVKSDIPHDDNLAIIKNAIKTIKSQIPIIDIISRKQSAFVSFLDSIQTNVNMGITTMRDVVIKSTTPISDSIISRTFFGKSFVDNIVSSDMLNLVKKAQRVIKSTIPHTDSVERYRTNTRVVKSVSPVIDVVHTDESVLKTLKSIIPTNDTISIIKQAIYDLKSTLPHNDKVELIKKTGRNLKSIISIISDTVESNVFIGVSFVDNIISGDMLSLVKKAERNLKSTIPIMPDKITLEKFARRELKSILPTSDKVEPTAQKIKTILSQIRPEAILSTGTGRDVLLAVTLDISDKVNIIKNAKKELFSFVRIRDVLTGPSQGITFDVNTIRRKVFRF